MVRRDRRCSRAQASFHRLWRKQQKAPLIRGCRRTFSPSPRGEGTGMRLHQHAACNLATPPASLCPAPAGRRDQHARSPACGIAFLRQRQPSFAPRSGEKVVRQHRMRGRGRRGAIAVAALCERRFISLAGEDRKRPSSAAAAAPSPRRHGEKGQACAFTSMQLAILRHHQLPFAPRSGKRDGWRDRKNVKLQSRESACLSLLPVATGRRCGGSRG